MRHYIHFLPQFRLVALLILSMSGFLGHLQAQTGFRASVSSSSVATNTPFSYVFNLTNTVSTQLQDVFITNRFSSNLEVISITNTFNSVGVTNFDEQLILIVPNLVFGSPVTIRVTVQSTNAISVTNFVSMQVLEFPTLITTNLVTLVTNISPVQTDLAVSITGPEPDVYVNDWITFGVVVTNRGGSSASGVILSNSFPPAMVRAINPANVFTNGTEVISLGTVTNGTARTFSYTVQSTNAGALPFSTAAISASDTNTANNTAVTNVVVSSFLTNLLVTDLVTTTQKFNLFNGLMEQRISVSNASLSEVSALRVRVSGLGSTNRLVNAVGTNDGRPFVVHAAELAAQQTVNLTLQFKVPSHQQFALFPTNLVAQGMNAVNLTPPANLILTNAIGRITNVLGYMVIEFPSTNGRTYTIVYDDDIGFSNPKVVRPSITAPANWTYWIDHGPPATVSEPMNAPTRFYKVYRNP